MARLQLGDVATGPQTVNLLLTVWLSSSKTSPQYEGEAHCVDGEPHCDDCRHGHPISAQTARMNTLNRKTAVIAIRIKPSLKAAAMLAAKAEGRSLSNWIERLMEKAVKAHPTTRKPRK